MEVTLFMFYQLLMILDYSLFQFHWSEHYCSSESD